MFGLAAASVCALTEGARPEMRDFIGLNGHTVQFKPELYRPVCRLVRDYHPVEWDLGTNTSELPHFPLAKNGVDWSEVYGSWRARGWSVDSCLMFETVKQPEWHDLQADARAYGRAFAREFGPSGKRRSVSSVEIGNEPGKWSDAQYSLVFTALAQGVREGDPKMTIATCNATTGTSGDYEKSVACVEKHPDLFDVLSVHTYAQLQNWPTWRRSFPEDPRLPHYLQDVEAVCHWRDAHAPGKPVWVTEFGYDSTTKPAETKGDFSRWVGVTDTQQAQWLVRSLLVFSAMPVERAYIQEYQDALKQTIWVAWSPTREGRRFSTVLARAPGRLTGAQRMPLDAEEPAADPTVREIEEHRLEVTIDESPLYLLFEPR
ncbi:MAG: cellulase family glycosylhydrolase [Limisphaerales bacterium]